MGNRLPDPLHSLSCATLSQTSSEPSFPLTCNQWELQPVIMHMESNKHNWKLKSGANFDLIFTAPRLICLIVLIPGLINFSGNRLKFVRHESALPRAAFAKRIGGYIDTEFPPLFHLHVILQQEYFSLPYIRRANQFWQARATDDYFIDFTWIYFQMLFLFVIIYFINETYFWPQTLSQWLNSKVRKY